MQTNDHTQNDNGQASGAMAPEALASAPRYAELMKLVAGMQQDFHKFYVQGNKAAGTRVRQAMQELKTFAQSVRTEVQEIKNESKSA
ncbi:MAG TPA: hypothetical protein VKZ63_00400 [Kofleriaceae bacterium]|nr:hypothetical protein [Kofleriaceae bacterium]